MAITVTINEDDFLDMLVDRVRSWTDDEDTIELFEQYYDHMVYNGCFEGVNRSIAEIVDNDYVNNTSIITEEEYNKAREEFIQESMDGDGFTEDNLEEGETLEDLKKQREEARQQYEEDIPTFDDLEIGEIPSSISDFLDGYYIEAKTDSCLLVTW